MTNLAVAMIELAEDLQSDNGLWRELEASNRPLSMTRETRADIIDFGNRSFRDVADRDYIAARVCHRLGLEQQFLWIALQAVEKYLKGILLFSRSRRTAAGRVRARAFRAAQRQ